MHLEQKFKISFSKDRALVLEEHPIIIDNLDVVNLSVFFSTSAYFNFLKSLFFHHFWAITPITLCLTKKPFAIICYYKESLCNHLSLYLRTSTTLETEKKEYHFHAIDKNPFKDEIKEKLYGIMEAPWTIFLIQSNHPPSPRSACHSL